MTEEQRWRQQQQIEMDRNKCLKGIWDELKNITGLMKIQTCVSPGVANARLTANDLASLVKALEKPSSFVPPSSLSKEELIEFTKKTIKMPDNVCDEKPADIFKYEDYVSALNSDWEKTGDYNDAKFNGEWHGERIDPSDPSRK